MAVIDGILGDEVFSSLYYQQISHYNVLKQASRNCRETSTCTSFSRNKLNNNAVAHITSYHDEILPNLLYKTKAILF